MNKGDIEKTEIDLLLEAIFLRYGYDFRSYARASVDRRVRQYAGIKNTGCISNLIPMIMHDEAVFSELAQQFSISVTEMFRDPFVYRALREQIVPVLKTFPFVKAWAAGCATGEEVYSLAIVLAESNLLGKSTVFGTDFNDECLRKAKLGIYSTDLIQAFTRNYQESGGTRSFSEYYHAGGDSVKLVKQIREHITFANHNLTADQVFGEMNLIICRNVLIYFNRDLQERVLRLFTNSLVRNGILILGTREDIQFSGVSEEYEVVDKKARIYKRRAR
jgi:chemotaxis protein methyltransferase CheR